MGDPQRHRPLPAQRAGLKLIPDRLRARLREAGLTPGELDARAGFAPGTTDALLAGRGTVHAGELVLLSMRLDCLVQALIDDTGDTDADRDFILAGNSLTQADASLLLAAVYRTVDEKGREELRLAAQAIIRRRV